MVNGVQKTQIARISFERVGADDGSGDSGFEARAPEAWVSGQGVHVDEVRRRIAQFTPQARSVWRNPARVFSDDTPPLADKLAALPTRLSLVDAVVEVVQALFHSYSIRRAVHCATARPCSFSTTWSDISMPAEIPAEVTMRPSST